MTGFNWIICHYCRNICRNFFFYVIFAGLIKNIPIGNTWKCFYKKTLLFYFNICWHHQKSVVNHGIMWESTMPSRGILGDSESPTSPLHKSPSHLIFSNKWDKLFKNRPSQIFKSCLPQILLGPFLNILSQM